MAAPAQAYDPADDVIEEPIPQAANDNQAALKNAMRNTRETQSISNVTAFTMVVTALAFDAAQIGATFLHGFNGLQFVPAFGQIVGLAGSAMAVILTWYIGVLAQILFFVWFFLIGVRDQKIKRALGTRMLIFMSTFVAELVPLINALPTITLGVVAIILITRAEDIFGDARQMNFRNLRTLVRGQLPMLRYAAGVAQSERAQAEQASGGMAKRAQEKKDALISAPKYIQDLRQKRMAEALREDVPKSWDIDKPRL